MSPLVFGIKATTVPNLCLECGEPCRRPKHFCSDAERELFGRNTSINRLGVAQVAAQRQQRGITPEALDFKRKRSIQNGF